MPCNFLQNVAIHNAVSFPKTRQKPTFQTKKHPLYSDKHNAAVVVLNVSTKNRNTVRGGEEFMFA